MEQYIPKQAYFSHEIEVKHSRFITHIAHTSNNLSAAKFLEEIQKQHPKANHNCWAKISGNRKDLNCWGSNDDGEPKGTAGKPMLNVLSHSNLCEITVVVTRYFGGIKLGAGGLVRAYSLAVQEATKNLPSIEKIDKYEFNLHLPHSLVGDIELILNRCGIEVEQRLWSDQLHIIGKGSQAALIELKNLLIPFQHQTKYQDKDIRW